MTDESKLDFHESTIIEFVRHNNDIKMIFEEVFYINELKKTVVLTLHKIKTIETDAKDAQYNLMAAKDGEVICLEFSKNSIDFVIEWNNFAEKLRFHHGYKIIFDNYDIILS